MPNSRYDYVKDTIRVSYPDGAETYNATEVMPTTGGGIGPDTGDATATASDIRKPKTAYIAAGKVIGTIEDYTGATQ